MATPRKAIVLVSGGLDSVVLLHDLIDRGTDVTGLTFRYGARHNGREGSCSRRQCRLAGVEQVVMDLDFVGRFFRSHLLKGGGPIPEGHYEDASMRQTVVPFRNGIMLAAAAGLAESTGADAVAIAAHGGDHAIYPDCRPGFMAAMATAMTRGTYGRIRLLRPYVHARKHDLVTIGQRLGVRFEHTWSCYRGGRLHCGACGTCVERREAFLAAGVVDPTRYAATPLLPERSPCR